MLERTVAEKGTRTGCKGEFLIVGIAAGSVIWLLLQEESSYLWSNSGYKIIAAETSLY